MDPQSLQRLALVAPVLLFSLVAHEYAHGYAALRQGDPTAYQLGRLTWNPVKHIDPLMTVIVPLLSYLYGGIIFGGAKPIPVNPRNYRSYKRGDIIVSLAGVTTNLALAFVAAALFALFGALGRVAPALNDPLALLQRMMELAVAVNLLLCAFNLIPLPPLDGSHVVKYLLPARLAVQYEALGRYGILVLFALLYLAPKVIFGWMAPAFMLGRILLDAASPLQLVSPWTT